MHFIKLANFVVTLQTWYRSLVLRALLSLKSVVVYRIVVGAAKQCGRDC